ncbi:hypothetical protein [Brevundimonas diminuta]|uniref:hypothetical protein n=1 Tax=Brevundimonas diminuta TaxID=293 RepID=UPI003D04670C
MGRYLSSAGASALGLAAGGYLLPGQLPGFGSGRIEVLGPRNTAWRPPAGVTRIRVRVAGGGGGTETAATTSFGALISATGGAHGTADAPGAGGQGFGGDFQASGGPGGAGRRSGGGAAGSELGDGGAGGAGHPSGGAASAGGGGAVGGRVGGAGTDSGETNARNGSGASPFADGQQWTPTVGPLNPGGPDFSTAGQYANALGVALPHPLFAFIGCGGRAESNNVNQGGPGGGGAGASNNGGPGGVLGGGGGSTGNSPGMGGLYLPADTTRLKDAVSSYEPRYIGGGRGGDSTRMGSGGGGYARGEFDVLPGVDIPLTIPAHNTAGCSGGIIIVEY